MATSRDVSAHRAHARIQADGDEIVRRAKAAAPNRKEVTDMRTDMRVDMCVDVFIARASARVWIHSP